MQGGADTNYYDVFSITTMLSKREKCISGYLLDPINFCFLYITNHLVFGQHAIRKAQQRSYVGANPRLSSSMFEAIPTVENFSSFIVKSARDVAMEL